VAWRIKHEERQADGQTSRLNVMQSDRKYLRQDRNVTGRMAGSQNRHAGRKIKVERQEIIFHYTDKQTVLTIIVNTDMH
jgi:hypothetical protein